MFRCIALSLMLLGLTSCGPKELLAPESFEISFDMEGLSSYTLVADLYTPIKSNGIGIVFLHGSSPYGRRLALYPALATELQKKGYLVTLMDQRGYGDSDDPEPLDNVRAYSFVNDALGAVVLPNTLDKIVIAGHSKGAGVAMTAGLSQPDMVDGIISISPGRRFDEMLALDPASDKIQYLQKRKSKDMQLATPIPADLIQEIIGSYDVSQWRGATISTPLLYIEGANEPEKDLAFSVALLDSMQGPIRYERLPDVGHYFGTSIVNTDGKKSWQVTDQEKLNLLVETLDQWLQAL